MWTRFFPAVKSAREAIARGDIGEVVGCTVQFGFNDKASSGGTRRKPLPVAPPFVSHPNALSLHDITAQANTPRLRQKALGGGALLDIGVYCLHVVRFGARLHK